MSINVNGLPQIPFTPQPGQGTGAPAPVQEQPPQDGVTIGGIATKAAEVVAGGSTALAMGIVKGGIGTLTSSVSSAFKGLDLDPSVKGANFSQRLTGFLLKASPFFGALMGSSGGPLGMVLGALAGPGFVGGSIAAWGGAFKGMGEGIELAGTLGDKVKAKVTPKMGEFAGKAAKFATSVAAGLVTVPLFGFSKAIDTSFDFAKKAVGIDKKPATKPEAWGQLAKLGAITFGFFRGLVGASGGPINMVLGGAQGVGGAATVVAGAEGGAKAFKEGAKEGYEKGVQFVDRLIGKKD